jgi:hypothetical protein
MPFEPLVELDLEKLEAASRNLCEVFRVPSLRIQQIDTGQNVLKGISTILDIPTGGGKTLAYWYPLFYYWAPGNIDENCQKKTGCRTAHSIDAISGFQSRCKGSTRRCYHFHK